MWGKRTAFSIEDFRATMLAMDRKEIRPSERIDQWERIESTHMFHGLYERQKVKINSAADHLDEWHRRRQLLLTESTPSLGIYGFQVYVNDAACKTSIRVQYRFPKSRKGRIRAKWRKRAINYRSKEVERMLTYGNKVIVGTQTFEKLKKGATLLNR